VVLSLGGYSPYGYMSDTKIEIAKAEDNILPLVGVDGDLSLALNRQSVRYIDINIASY
jgi:hypothetical protein